MKYPMAGDLQRETHVELVTNPSIQDMTDDQAKQAFWDAVEDPSPESMEIAQDIALARGWKLADLGALDESQWTFRPKRDTQGKQVFEGVFTFGSHKDPFKVCSARWCVFEVGTFGDHVVEMRFEFVDFTWPWQRVSLLIESLLEAKHLGARIAWAAIRSMKVAIAKGGTLPAMTATFMSDFDPFERAKGVDRVPSELVTNPRHTRDDAKYALIKALRDPDPSSMQVATDLVLEYQLSIGEIGEELARADNDRWLRWGKLMISVGAFYFTDKDDMDGVTWAVTQTGRDNFKRYRVHLRYEYRGLVWDQAISASVVFDKPLHAIQRAVEEAWYALGVLKRLAASDVTNIEFVKKSIATGFDYETPQEFFDQERELLKNPADNDELAAAREKYEEFHRYEPKKEGSFPASFKIPARLLCAGKGKFVTYRSAKVDPATLQKPRKPVDYIHEFNAGVHVYLADKNPDTSVPETFRDVGALVKLGDCLGFCVIDSDGEEVEAVGKRPLPELYCTTDGKCLFVIQDKKEVVAAIWGGALGVFARGIDG